MGFITQQLRQALRRLRQAPLVSAITLLTLAIGIGANTAVFSVVEGVLLRPLPYPHPEQLVGLWQTAPGVGIADLNMSRSNYVIFRAQNRVFQDVGIYQDDSVAVTGHGQPLQVPALDVSDGVLPMLGAKPLLGRLITRFDDTPQAPATVVLTYGFWQREFGGDPRALGQTLILDGKPFQVIGVLPRNFRFLGRKRLALIEPFQFDPAKLYLGGFGFYGLARLRPGVSLAAANADVGRMWPIVLRSFPPPPGFNVQMFAQARIGPNLRPLKRDVIGNVGQLLWIIMAGLGLVLLIACANVANLLLVRTEGRQQELAIRAALGSSRRRIAGELWFESLVVALLGGALGLAVAYGAIRLLVALAPGNLPRLDQIGLNGPVLLFCLGAAIFSGLLFGSLPALKYSSGRYASGLRTGGRTLSESRERHRARNVLVVVQVALAFVLLVGSGLLMRTFSALTHVHVGFSNPRQVETFGIYIPPAQAAKAQGVLQMEQAMQRKLAALPGVNSVGITTVVPMSGNGSMDPIFAADRSYAPGAIAPLRHFVSLAPPALRTMGTPLIAGRYLTWADSLEERPVALISANFAREYWGGPAQALGKRIRAGAKDHWRQIVGVVGDVRYFGPAQPAASVVYFPLLAKNFDGNPENLQREISFVIRTPRAGARSLLAEVRAAVGSVNAKLPLQAPATLAHYTDAATARTSFTLVMLALAGGMALLLGVIGLYGVLAYAVTQRTREIGIRLALGAEPGSVVAMMLRQGAWLAGVGLLCGLVVALLAMRGMASLLYGIRPTDPLTYAVVVACLAAATLLASYLPARRAAAVDPVEALRAE